MSLGHLRSLLFTDPLIVLLTIGFGTVSFFATLFDRSGRLPEKLARPVGAVAAARRAAFSCRIEGLEKIDPDAKLRVRRQPSQLHGYSGGSGFGTRGDFASSPSRACFSFRFSERI